MSRIHKEDTPTAFAQALLEVTCADSVAEQAAGPHGDSTISSVFAYSPNGVDMVQALWWSALDEFDRRLQGASGTEGGPIQPIKALGTAYARFALKNPARFRDLFSLDTGRLAAELNHESTYRMLLQMVMEATEQRGIRLTDPELTAQILWSAIHGIFSLINSWPVFPFRSPALLVSTMMDIMLAGVLATSAPDRKGAGEEAHEAGHVR